MFSQNKNRVGIIVHITQQEINEQSRIQRQQQMRDVHSKVQKILNGDYDDLLEDKMKKEKAHA